MSISEQHILYQGPSTPHGVSGHPGALPSATLTMQAGNSIGLKRSHSPENAVMQASTPTPAASKRPRPEVHRPALADAYLDCLTKAELVHLLKEVEQLLHDTPHEADLLTLLYPSNIEERVTQHHLEQAASAAAAEMHAQEARHTPVAQEPPAVPQEPAVPRPYTPSIPAQTSSAPTPTSSSPQLPQREATMDSAPGPASSSSNISSRIAAILDSIHNTNTPGPMLNLQGQPLAPSKQAFGTSNPSGLSLLGNTGLLSNNRAPANSALTKLLEQNTSSSDTNRFVPHVDVPRPTPGPFDYTRLATGTSSLGTIPSHSAPNTSGGYGGDTHDDSATHRDTTRMTSTLPSYEDMIVEGLQAIGDVNGTPPRMLFHWMEDTYPLMKNFRPSASQALQKAFKRGRLHKVGSLYRINPDWDGSNTGRKPTRRPQVGKDHPMMINGPKGPAPASPFKARAQFQGAAAYRQNTSPFSKQRNAHSRLLQSLRPGPKPYGQPGAAPLDNPASSIFQNGAAAAALLLAHQQRSRDGNGDGQNEDLTPSLTSLVQQLRASNNGQGSDTPGSSSLSSMLASALLKHVQRPGFTTTPGVETNAMLPTLSMPDNGTQAPGNYAQSPVLQSLSRLLGTRGEEPAKPPATASTAPAPSTLPATGPGSLSASIETLMRQASRAAQASQEPPTEQEPPSTSQTDLDAAVSQTLEAAFQEIDPSDSQQRDAEATNETTELDGIDLSDYGDALRTLTAALTGSSGNEEDDENERHLADERAIAEAEADQPETHSQHEDSEGDGEESSESRMASLLKSYGVDVSGDAVRHLTETLRDPSTALPHESETQREEPQGSTEVASEAPQVEAPQVTAPPVEQPASEPAMLLNNDDSMDEASKNQAIQSQLEALIASLAQDGPQSEEE